MRKSKYISFTEQNIENLVVNRNEFINLLEQTCTNNFFSNCTPLHFLNNNKSYFIEDQKTWGDLKQRRGFSNELMQEWVRKIRNPLMHKGVIYSSHKIPTGLSLKEIIDKAVYYLLRLFLVIKK